MKANPGADIKWVIYNGNENGTGVLQSKFAGARGTASAGHRSRRT